MKLHKGLALAIMILISLPASAQHHDVTSVRATGDFPFNAFRAVIEAESVTGDTVAIKGDSKYQTGVQGDSEYGFGVVGRTMYGDAGSFVTYGEGTALDVRVKRGASGVAMLVQGPIVKPHEQRQYIKIYDPETHELLHTFEYEFSYDPE
jgi:hypothetical protein